MYFNIIFLLIMYPAEVSPPGNGVLPIFCTQSSDTSAPELKSKEFDMSKTAQLQLLGQPHSWYDSTNHNPEPLPTTVCWARSLPGPLHYHFWFSVLENYSLHTQSSPTTEKIWPIVWAANLEEASLFT